MKVRAARVCPSPASFNSRDRPPRRRDCGHQTDDLPGGPMGFSVGPADQSDVIFFFFFFLDACIWAACKFPLRGW